MDTILCLTETEKSRYAQYLMWTEFTEGFDDYILSLENPRWPTRQPMNPHSPQAKAYDAGQDCAIRRQIKSWRLDHLVSDIMKEMSA
jgi:hypothetical protein